MANKKISAFVSNPARSSLDTLTGLDVSASAANQNAFWSLNTLFSVITTNTTDGAIRFGGVAAPAVSAAGQGWLYFDSTLNTLMLSENTGAYAAVRSGTVTVPQGGTGRTTLTAYALLAGGTTTTGNVQSLAGVGTSGQVLTSNGAGALPTFQTAAGTIGGSISANQVAFGTGANTIGGDAGLSYNSTTNILTVGETTGGGVGLLGSTGFSNILASQAPAATLVTYWPNAAPTAGQFLYASTVGAQVQLGYQTAPSGSGSNTQVAVWGASNALAGSSALTFSSGILSNLAAVNGDSGFFVNQTTSGTAALAGFFTQTTTSAAYLRQTSALFTPTGLFKANQVELCGGAGTVELLFTLVDSARRFVWGINSVEVASLQGSSTEGLVLGVASSLTGRIKLYNSAGATYTQISSGNAGSSLNFIWPVVNPTAGQVLSASAPSGSNVTLSWAAASSGSALTATQVGFGDGSNLLSGSSAFTYTDSTGVLDLTKTGLNSSVRMTVANASAGTAAQARFGASANVSGIAIAAYSSTFTTAGLITANTAHLDMDAPNAVIAAQAAGVLIFGMGTTTERARLSDTTFLLSVDPTTGNGLSVASATVTSGSLARIAMTGTVAAANTKTGLAITSTGANGTASQTVFGSRVSVTNTGTTNTNIALQLTASGAATQNTAMDVTAGDIRAAQALASYTFSGGGVPSTTGMGYAGGTLALSYSGTAVVGISSTGGVNFVKILATGQFGFTLSGYNDNLDTILRRSAAANFAFGAADAVAPVAQTLSVQNVVAGTANTAGVDWTHVGSRGTGTGQGGAHIFQVAPLAGSSSTQNTLINGLVLTGDGRLYGAALHNNVGPVTGTTNQYVASGTYTPTVTAEANAAAATDLGECQWMRVGNVVTVSGEITVDPTLSATLTQAGISLPIASNFAGNNQCCGTAVAPAIVSASGAILGDITNDRAQLNFVSTADVASRAWVWTFTYVVT